MQSKKMYYVKMELNEAIAETLRELRTLNDVSQEMLAEGIDSHQVYISEIENGKKIPSLPVLFKVAQYFDIPLSELVHRIETNLKIPSPIVIKKSSHPVVCRRRGICMKKDITKKD